MKRLIAALAACVLALHTGLAACAAAIEVRYAQSDEALQNPFIGNSTWAEDTSEREQPFALVYANLTWAELEPEEGVFAFDAFEERCHFDKWRAEGKRLILRFVMDVPGSKKHADIPDWLLDRIGGAYYKVSYGRGFCPDYENEALIAAHARAVAALGERYDGDPFVAYVQLGSLGHWGEWHVHKNAGTMPPEAVRDRYAQAYTDAFANTFLMMRRPFRYAAEHGMGLYNDTAGHPKSTGTWLGWIAEGGVYDATHEENALVPMPDAWQTAPIGGELSTSMEDEELLGEPFDETLALFLQSHTSWIGPGSFVGVERGGDLQAPLDTLLRAIGYRLRVESARLALSPEGAQVTLTWQNDGCAPLYYAWPVCLRVTHEDGAQELQTLDMDVREVLPERAVQVSATLPAAAQRVEVAILDPDTGAPGIQLGMHAPQTDGWYTLFETYSAE